MATLPTLTPSPWRARLGGAYRTLRWVPVVLVVAACIYEARNVDTAALGRSLEDVRFWPLGLALLFSVLGVIARSTYWWVLVRPVAAVPLRTMISYGFASSAANVLPMRAGDALRVWLVSSRHGVPIAMSGAIIAIEKVSDVASLLILISPLPWLIPALPPSVGQALRFCSVVVLASVVAMAIASRHASRWKILSGFSVVRKPKVVLLGMAFVFLAWACDVSSILSVLMAVHLAATLDKALLVILFVNMAIAVPVTPGQVGVHELGSTVALALFGVAQAQALPFAVLYHAIQLFPVLVGLSTARSLSRERIAAERAVPAGDTGPTAPS
jgi:uncharacterized membrane protein YbhN (UPF0104 family)